MVKLLTEVVLGTKVGKKSATDSIKANVLWGHPVSTITDAWNVESSGMVSTSVERS